MSSVFGEIVDLSQLQRESAAPDTPPPPSMQPRREDSPPNGGESPSDSDDEDEEPGAQSLSSAQDSPDGVAEFAINAARNLQLTTDGERSLLRFSQVVLFSLFSPRRTHIVQTS